MPVPPLAADARSTGAALLQSIAQSGVDLLPGQMGGLLRGQGQLFWFGSPSCCGEPRSLATAKTSLACSSFPLFEQGAEMSGETVGQRQS